MIARRLLRWLLMALLALAFAHETRAQTPPPQNWTRARFEPFAGRLAATDAEITLFEGLPHQLAENALFRRERDAKGTEVFGGYYFYQVPLSLSPADAATLRAACADAQSYAAYSGPKKCGGFHPDYALRWGRGREAVYTLVCFGCQEVQTVDRKTRLVADLPDAVFRRLQTILGRYQAQRPPPERR